MLNTLLGTLSSGVAAATGSYESIASYSPTSGTSVTFSSIPSSYSHLQIRAAVKMGQNESPTLTVNGAGGTSYAWHALYSRTSLSSVQATGSDNTGTIKPANFNNNTSGTYLNVMIIDLIDYASTTKNKTIRVFAGCDDNGGGYNEVSLSSGLYNSTTAITSLTLAYSGAYQSGTTISLYGIKG